MKSFRIIRPACMIVSTLAATAQAQEGSAVVAFGANEHGQCEARRTVVGAVQVSAGDHSVALRGDGSLAAWGLNDNGQCNVPANLGPVAFIGTGLTTRSPACATAPCVPGAGTPTVSAMSRRA